MDFIRRNVSPQTYTRSAETVRERLLSDRAMKNSRGRHTAQSHQKILNCVFPTPGPDTRKHRSLPHPGHLSAGEQKRQVLEVAKRFDQHYLASIEYLPERYLTIGALQPAKARRTQNVPSYEIRVDAYGNVSISTQHAPSRSRFYSLIVCTLLSFGTVALGVLMIIV